MGIHQKNCKIFILQAYKQLTRHLINLLNILSILLNQIVIFTDQQITEHFN